MASSALPFGDPNVSDANGSRAEGSNVIWYLDNGQTSQVKTGKKG